VRGKMTLAKEKTLLQMMVALSCVVPLSAGLLGAVQGMGYLEGGIDLDSHFRYLSGLLLGISIGFGCCIPRIETRSERIRLMTGIVVVGGLCRMAGCFLVGMPGPLMVAALGMELMVTPLLCWWQQSLARRIARYGV